LNADHEEALLAFELANRSDFAASNSDRGDECFSKFAARHAESLAEQQAGKCAHNVLVAEDGSILAGST
jgi:[ribosomal protein S5]-alanine N-acetyltransferase